MSDTNKEREAMDAIWAAWHGSGTDIAGGNWARFSGMLPPLSLAEPSAQAIAEEVAMLAAPLALAPGLAPHQPQPEGDYQRGWKDGNDTANKVHAALAQPQPEPTSKGEPVSEEIAAMLGERVAFLRDPAVYRGKYWDSMTNEQRKQAFTKLDGGAAGYAKKFWTWRHFDMAAEDIGMASQQREPQEAAEVKYVPVDASLRDANYNHPNDKEPCTPECRKALNVRGDDEGQGLDSFWKWGFKAGFNAALSAPQEAGKPEPCATIADCTTPKLCLSVGTCKGYYVMPASVRESASKEAGKAEPDMRAICEALGFDPTNHHNAAKCPYCRPTESKEAGKVEAVADEREAFEAAMVEAGYKKPERGEFSKDQYKWQRDQDRFVGWQARASLCLRPSQQALGDEEIDNVARDLLANIGPDMAPLRRFARAILAAAGGSKGGGE